MKRIYLIWTAIILVVLAIVIWMYWVSQRKLEIPPTVTLKPGESVPLEIKGRITFQDIPDMPLEPIRRGKLSGMVVILDPGHGGVDPGCYWTEKFRWQNRTTTFYEAGYTYRLAWELAWKLRANGAQVFLTTYSKAMLYSPTAQSPLPIPRDAIYILGGQGVVARSRGIRPRVELARNVLDEYGGPRKVVFLSLHVDSMPGGWQGAHVCIDRHTHGTPRLAKLLAKRLEGLHLERRHNGRPVDVIARRGLYVLNGVYNPVPERALLELATPVSDNDSWRLRSDETRRRLVEEVYLALSQL